MKNWYLYHGNNLSEVWCLASSARARFTCQWHLSLADTRSFVGALVSSLFSYHRHLLRFFVQLSLKDIQLDISVTKDSNLRNFVIYKWRWRKKEGTEVNKVISFILSILSKFKSCWKSFVCRYQSNQHHIHTNVIWELLFLKFRIKSAKKLNIWSLIRRNYYDFIIKNIYVLSWKSWLNS